MINWIIQEGRTRFLDLLDAKFTKSTELLSQLLSHFSEILVSLGQAFETARIYDFRQQFLCSVQSYLHRRGNIGE